MACCAAVPTFAKQHMLADRGERATLLQKYLLRIFYAVSLIVKVHLEPLVCVLVHTLAVGTTGPTVSVWHDHQNGITSTQRSQSH